MKLYASEVVKLLKDRGKDTQAAERARRPKLNLADFGKVIIQEKDGIMHPVDKNMALQAIKLWEVGPDSLNDFLLMTEV